MTGMNEFLELFGGFSVTQLIWFLLATAFVVSGYKKFRDYLIKKHESEQKKDEKINQALAATEKYPEYRQQSLEIQKALCSEIQDLRENQKTLSITQTAIIERLDKMEEKTNERDKNKLRDILLQNYRYYTNKETNPSQSWTKVESETFWALYSDYEESGGNGHMHTDVAPAMRRLKIVE